MKSSEILIFALLSLGVSACSSENDEPAPYHAIDNIIHFYSTSWCPYCKKARDFMDTQGVNYIEYDIEGDMSAKIRHEELLGSNKKSGKVGVPLFVINGKIIHGYSEKRLSKAIAAINRKGADKGMHLTSGG